MPGYPVLTARARNRALLARQLLLRRHEMTALRALEHLVGLQAQAPMPPYTGLWTRLTGFRPEELAELLTNREAVRIALMRSTVHLVSAKDCLELRPLLAPAVATGMYSTPDGKAMIGVDTDELASRAREIVHEKPLTAGEIGAALAEHWPDRPPNGLARHARILLPLVQVPPRGVWGKSGLTRSTTAENWLGKPLDTNPSPEKLVLRYLAAFGPASTKDAQKWSGLTGLGEVFDRLRPKLEVFEDEHGRALFDLPDAPRPEPRTPAPPRFLPEFDNILLSHDDRTHILSEEYRARLFTKNGIIPATILVNGVVRGRWSIERAGDTAILLIEPFEKISTKDSAKLTTEGRRLLKFSAAGAAKHEVRFSG